MNDHEVPTLGAEEELLLVDPGTGVPVMRNRAVAEIAEAKGVELQLELTPCQIETATPVLRTVPDLLAAVSRSRSVAATAAHSVGASVLAAGVPPLLPPGGPVTDTVRYRRIAAEYGIIAAEQGVCGAHVHVAVPDTDTAVQVSNHVRPWLPVLLALTANSALYDGRDTGYASWRSVLWSRWPSAGPPPFLRSVEHYRQLIEQLRDVGAILDDGMLYWDVRPSAHFPTVEVRISDVPATPADTALLAALVRALVMTATRDIAAGRAAPTIPEHALRWAYWRAARDGISSELVDPAAGTVAASADVLATLLGHVTPALEISGDADVVHEGIERIRTSGNGAARQRRAVERTGSISEAIRLLVETF